MRARVVIAALLISATGLAVAGIQQMLLADRAPPAVPAASLPETIYLYGEGTQEGVAAATLELGANGTDSLLVTYAKTSGGQPDTTWITAGTSSDFEVSLFGSGSDMSNFASPINTWLSVGPALSRVWYYEVGGSIGYPCDPCTFTGTLSVRTAGSHVVLATSDVSLSSDLLP